MRYTRYEYKKSGKIKFLCSIAVIAGISIGGGLYISNFIFNGKQIQDNNIIIQEIQLKEIIKAKFKDL